jgi:PAS domain S-box-containing protein
LGGDDVRESGRRRGDLKCSPLRFCADAPFDNHDTARRGRETPRSLREGFARPSALWRDGKLTNATTTSDHVRRGFMIAGQTQGDLMELFALSDELLCVSDRLGCITRASPSFERILGLSRTEVIGAFMVDVASETERDVVGATLTHLAANRETARLSCYCKTKDGRPRAIEWTAKPSEESIYWVGRDVTAARRAHAIEAARRRILEMIASDAPLVETLKALMTSFEAIQPTVRASAYLVAEGSRVAGEGNLVCAAAPSLPPPYANHVARIPICEGVGACGTAAATRRPVFCPDIENDPKWVGFAEIAVTHGLLACWSTPLIGARGELLGTFAGYLREARMPTDAEREVLDSAIHLAQIAIARSNANETQSLLQEALSRANDVVVIFDREPSRVRFVNEAFERLLGLRREDLLGTSLEILRPLLGNEDRLTLRSPLDAGRAARHIAPLKTQDGRTVWLDIDIVPIRKASGEIATWVAVGRDVTEQRRLEEQLRHAQKLEAIGLLAGGVAHDFNNILTGVFGFVDIALIDLEANATTRARNDLLEVRKAAERAQALTHQLLAFGRRQVLRIEDVDPNELLSGMEKLLLRILREDVQMLTAFGADVGRVRCDRGQLEQVLMNLVVNARDAMPRGGRLWISTTSALVDEATALATGVRAGSAVVLAVRDEGHGMDEATLAQIFEPFFTTKGVGEGSGLGLATVYGIVKQSGGHIAVESAPGRGTTFRVTLPCEPKPEVARTLEPPARTLPAPSPSRTVLVVEDDPMVRTLVLRVLGAQGYELLAAANGAEAIALADEHPRDIHLLLSDVVMPGKSGPEVAAEVTARRPTTRVLLMSGYPRNAMDGLGDRVSFIAKPFSARALLAAVSEAMGERRPVVTA